MVQPPARYVPQYAFPSFSYVPGLFPPAHAAAGNGFGPAALPAYDPQTPWEQSDVFWFGIDLFNHGFYWEAHEAWESLWHVLGRRGSDADFLKALIKLAAAGVKAREGRPGGVVSHALRAKALFVMLAASPAPMAERLELPSLISFADQIAAHAEQVLDRSDAPCVAVLSRLPGT